MRTKEMSRLMSSSGVPLVRLLVRKEVKHDHACTTEASEYQVLPKGKNTDDAQARLHGIGYSEMSCAGSVVEAIKRSHIATMVIIAGKIALCAVGDHCETKTLRFAGLLMSID